MTQTTFLLLAALVAGLGSAANQPHIILIGKNERFEEMGSGIMALIPRWEGF